MAAGILLYGLGGVFGLISTILYIILLVKLFKNGGVGLGILGLFCSPFTYIWGWMKSTELQLKKLMVWLTITLLIAGALFGAGAGLVVSSPEGQKAIKDAQEQQRPNGASPSY